MSHARACRSGARHDVTSSAPGLGGRELPAHAGERPVRRPLPGTSATRRARMVRRRSSRALSQPDPWIAGATWLAHSIRPRIRLQRSRGAGVGQGLAKAPLAQRSLLFLALHDLQAGRGFPSSRTSTRPTRRQRRVAASCPRIRAQGHRRLLVGEPHVVLLAPERHALRSQPALLRPWNHATAVATRSPASSCPKTPLSFSPVSRPSFRRTRLRTR